MDFFSDFRDDGWKAKLKLPPKDTRMRTSVSTYCIWTKLDKIPCVLGIKRSFQQPILSENRMTKLLCHCWEEDRLALYARIIDR